MSSFYVLACLCSARPRPSFFELLTPEATFPYLPFLYFLHLSLCLLYLLCFASTLASVPAPPQALISSLCVRSLPLFAVFVGLPFSVVCGPGPGGFSFLCLPGCTSAFPLLSFLSPARRLGFSLVLASFWPPSSTVCLQFALLQVFPCPIFTREMRLRWAWSSPGFSVPSFPLVLPSCVFVSPLSLSLLPSASRLHPPPFSLCLFRLVLFFVSCCRR